MKIEKQHPTIINSAGITQSGIVYEFCDLGIGNIHGNLIGLNSRRESDPISTSYTLTLEPQDILKLMTWLVGQEKHKEETSSSKPSWEPEIQDSKKYIKPVIMEIDKKIKQNQKIVDTVVKTYKSLVKDGAFNDVHEVEYSIVQELENIIKESTGKDIKDLEE